MWTCEVCGERHRGRNCAVRLHVPDSLKMIRETLCVAQTHVNLHVADTDRRQEHSDRLQRLIDDIDRQRPGGPDGKHGDRHTDTCGCDTEGGQ